MPSMSPACKSERGVTNLTVMRCSVTQWRWPTFDLPLPGQSDPVRNEVAFLAMDSSSAAHESHNCHPPLSDYRAIQLALSAIQSQAFLGFQEEGHPVLVAFLTRNCRKAPQMDSTLMLPKNSVLLQILERSWTFRVGDGVFYFSQSFARALLLTAAAS